MEHSHSCDTERCPRALYGAEPSPPGTFGEHTAFSGLWSVSPPSPALAGHCSPHSHCAGRAACLREARAPLGGAMVRDPALRPPGVQASSVRGWAAERRSRTGGERPGLPLGGAPHGSAGAAHSPGLRDCSVLLPLRRQMRPDRCGSWLNVDP